MSIQTTKRSEGTTIGKNSVVESWRPLLFVGVVLTALGMLAIVFPFYTGIAVELLFGGLLLAGAIAQGFHAIGAQRWSGVFAELGLGALYLIAGLVLLSNPLLGLATLTLILGAFFLADGVVEIYMALTVRPESNWVGLLISGALSLALAGLILVGWPSTALWAVGLLFGVNLIATGVALAALAMGGRRIARAEPGVPVA
jgi:uncharacterized membrane protein HdeD (DUF308 family)